MSLGTENKKESKAEQIDAATLEILNHIKILVVEDNMFNQTVVVDSINSLLHGAQVDVAGNGKIALDMTEKNNYDLMILDIQMPVMNGYETAEHIRKKFSHPKNNIPILAMTANVMKEEIEKCYTCGMNGYISKPFETEMLLNEIVKLIVKK